MPELGGYELCRMIKADEIAKNIPIVMYSKLDKNIDKFWAFRSGANAFVNKGELSQELLNVCAETIKKMPVSLEIKGKLLSVKSRTEINPSVPAKDDLVKDFAAIKEIDAEGDILALKILGTIRRYFKYDCAMLTFKDSEQEGTLFFDTGSLILDNEVFDEIKHTVAMKNPKINVILQKDEKTNTVADISDFFVKYEYEINVDSNIVGYLHLYAINNLNSSQLKLLSTIKDLVEHIMRLRYFRVSNKGAKSSANPRKLYTQLDFDRILSYECGWHKRNNAPLSLAFIEIESLESGSGAVEERARMRLGMVKNDEILFRLVPTGEKAAERLPQIKRSETPQIFAPKRSDLYIEGAVEQPQSEAISEPRGSQTIQIQ